MIILKGNIFIFLINLFIISAEEQEIVQQPSEFTVSYVTPDAPPNSYIAETFDNLEAVNKKWIKSKAKKLDVDAEIAKYDGVWSVEPQETEALEGDLGLVLKSKAKHSAIASMLKKPFIFRNKPFIVQYEVNLQNGQECGGAYIKLLSQPKSGKLDLSQFHDKTPYTIMFGPDKCGNDNKFHFIFRHVNPLNNTIEEKHCKRPQQKFEDQLKDKKPHLYTLVLKPDNTYSILLDHEEMNGGSLLEDFTPAINPPKEIEDPDDFKPNDWDERENIPDPTAKKPDDWDENAPRQIKDEYAEMPEGWLEKEAKLIPDPKANKPDDWDVEMDGEWEAPLISNSKCESAPGCGEWTAPMIDNPSYKGKWIAPTIDNPNYKGKWTPRQIENPHYYEDLEPFKMTSIGAVGIELWSMSDNIYFDNIIITDDLQEAKDFAARTFDIKVYKINKGEKGIVQRVIDYSNENPWIYAVYVLLAATPVVIIFLCCCSDDSKDKAAEKKKTDEVTEDDPVDEEPAEEEQGESNEGTDELDNEDEEEDEQAQSAESAEEKSQSGDEDKPKSPRQRKVRKD